MKEDVLQMMEQGTYTPSATLKVSLQCLIHGTVLHATNGSYETMSAARRRRTDHPHRIRTRLCRHLSGTRQDCTKLHGCTEHDNGRLH